MPEEKKTAATKSKMKDWINTILWAVGLALLIKAVLIGAYTIPTGSMQPTLLGKEDYRIGDNLLVNKFIYGSKVDIPFTGISLPGRFPAVRKPIRGDVIVFKYPKDPVRDYVKRCIGLPGDKLEIINKVVYINDKPLTNNLLPKNFPYEQFFCNGLQNFRPANQDPGDNFGPIIIPKKGDKITFTSDTITVGDRTIPNRMTVSTYPVKDHAYFNRERYRNEYFYLYYDPVCTKTGAGNEYTVNEDCYWGMGDNRDNSSDSRYWGFIEYKHLRGQAVVVYWPFAFVRHINKSFITVIGKAKKHYHGLRIIH